MTINGSDSMAVIIVGLLVIYLIFYYVLGNYETAVTSDFPSEHVEINDGVQELAFKELAFEILIFKVVNSQPRPLLRRRHGRLRRPGELELGGRRRVPGEPLPHASPCPCPRRLTVACLSS